MTVGNQTVILPNVPAGETIIVEGAPGFTTQLEVTATELDPGATPTVDQSGVAPNYSLDLGLPTTPVFQAPTIETIDSDATATVTDVGTVREPQYHFAVPRGLPGTSVIGEAELTNNGDGTVDIEGATGGPYTFPTKDYVTLRPSIAEKVMYVTPRGNDGNDGLTLKTAKASIGAAIGAGATFVQLGYGTHSADTSTISAPTTAGKAVTVRGVGRNLTMISYSGTGFCFDATSATPTSVTAALVGLLLQDLWIDGGNNTTSAGGINVNGAYQIVCERVYVADFAGAGAIGIQARNLFNATLRDVQVNSLPNGIGINLADTSGGIQLTQIQLMGWEIQGCSVALRLATTNFGEGLWLCDGAITLPAAGVGIQFTGSFGEVRIGPNVHIECAEPVATNTSTAVQAVAGSGLHLDTLTVDGLSVSNVKTLFDLDGSSGHIGTVDFDRIYASGFTGLAGTAFKLNTVGAAIFGRNILIPTSNYTSVYNLTNTTALYGPTTGVSLPDQTTDPTARASTSQLYGFVRGAAAEPRWIDELSVTTDLQADLGDRMAFIALPQNASIDFTGAGGGSTVGTVTTAGSANGFLANVASAASANAQALVRQGVNAYRIGSGSDLYGGFVLKGRLYLPDASYVAGGSGTGVRVLAGLATNPGTALGSDTMGSIVGVVFALRQVNGGATDAHWQLITNNGTSSTVTDTGLAFAAQHVYDFVLRCPLGSTKVYYRIADVTAATAAVEGSVNTTLPTGSVTMSVFAGLQTIDATARSLSLRSLTCRSAKG